jgi:hypothetical protein
MKTQKLLTFGAGIALLSAMLALTVSKVHGQDGTVNVPRTSDFVAPKVFQAAGPTAPSIQQTVEQYRNELGVGNNGATPGSLSTGHREINWDAVPSQFSAPNNLPANFFNSNSPRGAVFSTPGTGFQVSANAVNPTNTAVRFGNLNPNYPSIFQTLSPEKLFTALDSNVTDIDFFVAGSNTPALVSGFGSVFTDVDQPDGSGPGEKRGNRKSSTLIEYFGAGGELLFSSFVPASPGNGGLSFFGIVFPDARIAHVRVTSGSVPPGADDDDKQDVVVMDDFLYGEPKAAN